MILVSMRDTVNPKDIVEDVIHNFSSRYRGYAQYHNVQVDIFLNSSLKICSICTPCFLLRLNFKELPSISFITSVICPTFNWIATFILNLTEKYWNLKGLVYNVKRNWPTIIKKMSNLDSPPVVCVNKMWYMCTVVIYRL